MAINIADRVKETSVTNGTGSVTLGGAVTGYQSFATIGNGNECYYTIVNVAVATEWEVGIGTYTSVGTLLSRNTVLASSNTGALVSFSAGNKEVFVTYPAEQAVTQSGLLLDIGTDPNQIPLNQFLGSLAYQEKESFVIAPVASVVPAIIGEMVFQLTNDTTLVIKVKGSDGVVRSNTLTLA